MLKLLVLAVIIIGVSGYACPADQCKLPSCMCPSKTPPGGLSPKNIPQFITLTLDDAITAANHAVIMDVIGNNNLVRNPNGCPIAATFFVSTMYSDYVLVQKTYNQGNEVAMHTMNHLGDPSSEEIVGSQRAISAWAGIPKKDLLGFRAPFLNYSTQMWNRLKESGSILYDSSIPVQPNDFHWPYTMDFGPASACEVGTCDVDSGIPGLWQFPIYALMNDDGSANSSLDPVAATYDEVMALWTNNFMRQYNGDRQPFGVYLHVLWMLTDADRQRALKEFIAMTLKLGDVYWVTNQQLLKWMQNPTDIAASKTNPALGCATAPVNSNVCDGVSQIGDQCVWTDANVYSGYYAFNTCFGCPERPPNVTDQGPVPKQTKPNICFVPDQGCDDPKIWNPQTCGCVDTDRIPGGVSLSGLVLDPDFGKPANKNGSHALGVSLLPFIAAFFFLFG